MNWLAKLGVGILVIGVSFFLAWQLRELGPLGKDVVGAIVGIALLGAGVWSERNERYRILARAALGGGWALLFFVSYAAHHVDAARVISSPGVALVLMLVVAGSMVAHTLRYRSEAVTGLAFLLAFTTVALNRADVVSLTANVVLAVGFSVIVVRMRWFRLECFGIIAIYLNHYIWLRPVIEPMQGSIRPFAELGASATILLLYWAIFRTSFVLRGPPEERTSITAGMLNTGLLLVVMKYQSADPRLGFWLLLALGAVEIGLARLPQMRAKRMSFITLSVIGAALIAAAIPFRYAPSEVTPVWLVNAIIFITVGIVTAEPVYRRIGTAIAAATAVQLLAGPAVRLFGERLSGSTPAHEWAIGTIAVAVSLVLHADAVWLQRRWSSLFAHAWDRVTSRAVGYTALAVAMFAGWALFPESGAAVWWSALAVLLATLQRRVPGDRDVSIQALIVAGAALVRLAVVNLPSPATASEGAFGISWKVLTVVASSALLYVLGSLYARREDRVQAIAHTGGLWAGSTMLVLLAWLEIVPLAVVLAWVAFAAALAMVGNRYAVLQLSLQANALAWIAVLRLITVNLAAHDLVVRTPWEMTWRLLVVISTVALLYALSRLNDSTALASVREYVVAPLWGATGLLVLLPIFEIEAIAVSVVWIGLALALALIGRLARASHLLLQANVVVLLAVGRLTVYNLGSDDVAISSPVAVTWRLLTLGAAVAILYLLSVINTTGAFTASRVFTVAPLWLSAALLTLAVWFEVERNAVVIGWTILGFILGVVGRRLRNGHFVAQANAIAVVAIAHVIAVDFAARELLHSSLPLTWRAVSVTSLAALLYVLSRWNRAWTINEALRGHVAVPRAIATTLLMMLAWYELVPSAVLLVWTALAFALVLIGRRLELHDLTIQANLIALACIARAIVVNLPSNAILFDGPWSLSWRLASVAPVAALLYGLTRWNRFESTIETPASDGDTAPLPPPIARKSLTILPAWAGTGVLVLLAWYELLPASVVLAWTALALVLLEFGIRHASPALLQQAYVLTFTVVARIFVVNMNIDDGTRLGPRVYTILPIILAVLHVYRRIDSLKESSPAPPWLQASFAWAAALVTAALLRFELSADVVAAAWATAGLVAVAVGAITGRRVFLHIGLAFALATLGRAVVHNLYERSYFPSLHAYDRWLFVGAAAAALLASLPFAFRARILELDTEGRTLFRRIIRWIDARPEQTLFFIPLTLVTLLIATEMRSGMLTMAWAVEAFVVFIFAIWVRERSFRLSGIALLLLCVAKIFALDFWSLTLRDKALTGIVMGLALIGVSLLYTRKRETILKYL